MRGGGWSWGRGRAGLRETIGGGVKGGARIRVGVGAGPGGAERNHCGQGRGRAEQGEAAEGARGLPRTSRGRQESAESRRAGEKETAGRGWRRGFESSCARSRAGLGEAGRGWGPEGPSF